MFQYQVESVFTQNNLYSYDIWNLLTEDSHNHQAQIFVLKIIKNQYYLFIA
jgi:hypothetical protein